MSVRDQDETFQAYQQHQSNSTNPSDQSSTTASNKVAAAPKRQHLASSIPQDEALASAAADVQDNNDDGVSTPFVNTTARSMQPRLHPSSINKVNNQIRANATDNLQYTISQRDEAIERRIAKLDDQCATLGAILQTVLTLKDEWQTKLDTLSAAGKVPGNYEKAFGHLEANQKSITTAVTDCDEGLEAVEDRLGELEGRVEEMAGKVNSGSINADSVSSPNAAATLARLVGLEIRMTAIENAVESSSSKSSSAMEKRMASIEDQTTALANTIETLPATIDLQNTTMEGQMTALANKVKTLQAKMTSRDTTIHEQTFSINKQNTTIDSQTTAINEQKRTLASLDQKVEDFKRWIMTGS